MQTIIESQKAAKDEDENEIEVPHSQVKFLMGQVDETLSLAQMTRLKRQFIRFNKVGNVKGEIGDMFVQYLNAQCRKD